MSILHILWFHLSYQCVDVLHNIQMRLYFVAFFADVDVRNAHIIYLGGLISSFLPSVTFLPSFLPGVRVYGWHLPISQKMGTRVPKIMGFELYNTVEILEFGQYFEYIINLCVKSFFGHFSKLAHFKEEKRKNKKKRKCVSFLPCEGTTNQYITAAKFHS